MNSIRQFFLPYQLEWILDRSSLKLIEKSRQIGITYADAYDSVKKASKRWRPNDVWISSRDIGLALPNAPSSPRSHAWMGAEVVERWCVGA